MKKYGLLIIALVLATTLLISSCSEDIAITGTSDNTVDDLGTVELSEREEELGEFTYNNRIKASDIEKYLLSDFVTPKGRVIGNLDPSYENEAEQIANTNWYTAPSISHHLSRILKPEANNNNTGGLFNSRDKGTEVWEDSAVDEAMVPESAMEAEMEETPIDIKTETTPEHSKTNVQVEGVDEADIIKTDGHHIYYLSSKNGIAIVKAGETPEQVSKIRPGQESGEEGYPPNYKNLYISGSELIVVAEVYQSNLFSELGGYSYLPAIMFYIYDITSPESPTLKRNVEIVGNLNTTRFFDNKIYFVTTQTYDDLDIDDQIISVLPSYRDTLLGEDTYVLSAENINLLTQKYRYSKNYTMVGSFGLDDEAVSFNAYEGDTSGVYMSQKALYIANDYRNSYYYYYDEKNFSKTLYGLDFHELEEKTSIGDSFINRFELTEGEFKPTAMGITSGYLLNQYSMDEYQGTFRVAAGKNRDNGIYIYDVKKMNLVGSLNGLAHGEDIKSVRFTGVTAYVVTFLQVDPLFVIDLSNPTQPTLEGELKIPGFSTYLHPISENRVIGVGVADYGEIMAKDSEELQNESESFLEEEIQFSEWGRTAGVKVSLFDVSNPKMPSEVAKVILGNETAQSEALYNPKSIMFDESKGIMAFPMYYTDSEENVWNGGVVLSYTNDGIKEEAEFALGDYYGDGSRFVYIGNIMYYVSENALVYINYDTYEVLGNVKLLFS